MAELREFQLAAVDRIVSRLTDPAGSRRFLLADEVGLGKTLVARKVIQNLQQKVSQSKGRGFTVVYICSNSEIADQNCSKLCDEKDSSMPGRLTLLTLQSATIGQAREKDKLQVFAFTPGTSLRLEQGTGIAEERRLLLYLLVRVWRKHVNRVRWRKFFQCSAGPVRWEQAAGFKALKKDFALKVAIDLQAKLKYQWEGQEIRLLDFNGNLCAAPRKLSDCIDECVATFDEDSEFSRKNRNRVIGELRKGLARVALEFINPNLIVLDEFQRFSDVLLESKDQDSIVGRLFSKGSGASLILSATPYKMYTLAHENEDHHTDFLKTLAFLQNEELEGPSLTEVQKDLADFRQRLIAGDWTASDDDQLYALCRRIEERLKKVMCRTERNWYLEDAAKGVQEVTAIDHLPQQSELAEYVHLRRFLLKSKIGDWNITDFWKSSPSVLSFMDGQYALINRIRRQRIPIPRMVLRSKNELSEVSTQNIKFRLLFDKVFVPGERRSSAGGWKYLWVKPTYTYYKDTFYGDSDPKKFLVFSHWRFVPKAVSVLTSQEASKQIGRSTRRLLSAPLHFREKMAFYPFDVCYPSLPLSTFVDQLSHDSGSTSLPTEREMFAKARRDIRQLLKQSANVDVDRVRTAPLWKIMARLEGKTECSKSIQAVLNPGEVWESEETYLPQHLKEYLGWMQEDSPLLISQAQLTQLTNIALYSPAVCLLRAFHSVFQQETLKVWDKVLPFCLGPLRHYFNKRLVQTIIRRHGIGRSYTEKVLAYCRQAHFQAVLDEYCYLVRHVLQQEDPQAFLDHIGRAMGMWAGMPGVNERTGKGRIESRPRPMQAHFALAFGDDVSNESSKKKADAKSRKSEVREAFNSPFWPFILSTTSVGQEGLDFHLYCRDIVHWNLPSNPVDLEQREGRINRYDGLSIRRNIARDIPLTSVRLQKGDNLWHALFKFVTEKRQGNGRSKHGLFPHWIYEPELDSGDVTDNAILRRHLLFYAGSKDLKRYKDLKTSLSLYRLAFGQPRQQDILEEVIHKKELSGNHELHTSLAKYMINLSPFSPADALKRANREAGRLLSEPEGLRDLLMLVIPKHLSKLPKVLLDEIEDKVNHLVCIVGDDGSSTDVKRRERALAALLYLLDPYDAIHDCHGIWGHADDIKIITATHRELCGTCVM
jgi:hypothetical protein